MNNTKIFTYIIYFICISTCETSLRTIFTSSFKIYQLARLLTTAYKSMYIFESGSLLHQIDDKIHSPKFCPLGKFLIVFLLESALRGLHCSTDHLKYKVQPVWKHAQPLSFSISWSKTAHCLRIREVLMPPWKWQGMLLTRHML